MKVKILAAIFGCVLTAQSHSADQMRVFVSTKILQADGCNSNTSLKGIDEALINNMARKALENKGYAIAKSTQDATNGLHAKFDITLCGVSFGSVVHYSAALGMYAISSGTSKASKQQELPFSWANGFAFSAGDPVNNHAKKLTEYMMPQIRDHINSSF